MVLQSAYGAGVAEGPTIEISHEGLRAILSRIEGELHSSEVYGRAVAGLQTMLGGSAGSAQILVKAVGREAIRLAFQQFAKYYKVVPVSTQQTTTNEEENSTDSQPSMLETSNTPTQCSVAQETQTMDNGQQTMDKKLSTASTHAKLDMAFASTPASTAPTPAITKPHRKLSKAELAAQMAAQEREDRLRQIGEEIRRARQDRSLSVRQLYNQTFVQPHHIQALESGCSSQLPEDIYVRGFIRRIGEVLGLDGVALAASLPAPDPVKAVLPSWYRPVAASGFYLSSVHLYVGYAALVAGAVGGLAWMSNQSASTAAVDEPPPVPVPSSASISQSNRVQAPTSKPGVKSTETGIKAGADIAPPEAIKGN